MRPLLFLALLAACPGPASRPDAGEYEMERVRELRLDCEQGRGPNAECPEKPT